MVMAATPGKSHNHPSDVETPQLHYVRTRQGIDPEAVPSVVIAGVRPSGLCVTATLLVTLQWNTHAAAGHHTGPQRRRN
jgi:hypothetical protein